MSAPFEARYPFFVEKAQSKHSSYSNLITCQSLGLGDKKPTNSSLGSLACFYPLGIR